MSTHEPKDTAKPAGGNGNGNLSRRDFLLKLGLGLNVLAGAMISIPLIGYVMSTFVKRAPIEVDFAWHVGQVPRRRDDVWQPTRIPIIANGTVKRRSFRAGCAGSKAKNFKSFAIHCTHLGCPVRWFEESKLFMCPCHGGVFYEDGEHAAGPPPRGLYTYQHKVENNELFDRGRRHADFGDS